MEEKKFTTPEAEIAYLRDYITKLELSKSKLMQSLTVRETKDSVFNVHLSESDLTNFLQFDKCDQKLLAILYWEKLTDEQKAVFTDIEEMNLAKEFERKMQAIMTDPTKMKRHFLSGSFPILDDMIKLANGAKLPTSQDNFAFREVWEVLKGIITSANNPAPLLDLKGKDVSEQIDEILTSVTAGDITFVEAKEFMSLVSSGFSLQELPKLMAKLEALETR